MSLFRPSGNWPTFAGTALASEAVDAKSATAAKVLNVPAIGPPRCVRVTRAASLTPSLEGSSLATAYSVDPSTPQTAPRGRDGHLELGGRRRYPEPKIAASCLLTQPQGHVVHGYE